VVAGALAPEDRARVAEILVATGVFRPAEVDVGVELFDVAFGEGGGSGLDSTGYAFAGAFGEGRPEDGSRKTEGSLKPSEARSPASGASPKASRLLVGFACWGRTPETSGTFDLYWLAVDPAVQGSGAGSVLMAEMERRVASDRGRLIVIEVSGAAHSAGARRFYEKQGYVAAATVRDFYAPGDDRIIYTKRVPRATGGEGADG
jgi:ribosomal protein S18 acetylase RimI-like enzyme